MASLRAAAFPRRVSSPPVSAPSNQTASQRGVGLDDECHEDAGMKELEAELSDILSALSALPEKHVCRQALEDQAAKVKQAIYDSRPLGVRIDGLQGVLARSQSRLEKAQQDLADAKSRIEVETAAVDMYNRQLRDLEATIQQAPQHPLGDYATEAAGPPTNSVPEWFNSELAHIVTQLRADVSCDRALLAQHIEHMISTAGIHKQETDVTSLDLSLAVPEQTVMKEKAPPEDCPYPSSTRRKMAGKTLVETPQVGQAGSVLPAVVLPESMDM